MACVTEGLETAAAWAAFSAVFADSVGATVASGGVVGPVAVVACVATFDIFVVTATKLVQCLSDHNKHQDADSLRQDLDRLQREVDDLKRRTGVS